MPKPEARENNKVGRKLRKVMDKSLIVARINNMFNFLPTG